MNPKNFSRLSFSQREGKAALPEPMRPEHLPSDFRNLVWYAVDRAIRKECSSGTYGHLYYNPQATMKKIAIEYLMKTFHRPHDSTDHTPESHQDLLKALILNTEYDSVLSLVEFVLGHEKCPESLRTDLVDAFTSVPVAYSVQTLDDLPTIVARSDPDSGAATQQAIEAVEDRGPEGSKAHLRAAAQAINEKRYADSVRESIHAVESVARTIEPNAKTLGPALDALKQKGVLKHSALQGAFRKLYGYTSDEQGIRHALLNEGEADVDLDDSIFMFSACAAFAQYMVNRNEQVQANQ